MTARVQRRSMRAKIAAQGVWLFGGFGAAQACAFLRNAMLGHALSKGDFGIAATITLVLQLVETLSDLGSDRLIVQAADGARPRFMAASHCVLVARGFLIGAALLAIGPYLARYFDVPHATLAFQLMAFAPLIKGFTHLDFRRAQRRFDNRPYVALEALPQAFALAMTPAALALAPNYAAVAWLAVLQALAAVAISHLMARRPYRVTFEFSLLKRHLAFGWPILASALPLVVVYQGDRMIVGRLQGMEALAGFTAAFMVTMAPGVIAAKVGHAIMLPVFSAARRHGRPLAEPFFAMTELVVVASALYLALFVVAGERLLPLTFGASYAGLGAVTSWLAVMWAVRMIQAVPGMALMSAGSTKPLLAAGVIRAHALPIVLLAATYGASLATIAAIGAAFEMLSLAYVAVRVSHLEDGLGSGLAIRAAFLAPAGAISVIASRTADAGAWQTIIALAVSMAAIALLALAAMPAVRQQARAWIPTRKTPEAPLAFYK